ncbi:MAG: hypothetical protein R3B09_33940, partial [Nannocystaceae bacterium]
LADATITDVNGWVTGSVEGIAAIYRYLDRHRETSRDGSWKVYGPYEDDDGRDLSWLVKIDDVDGLKKFEFYVGARGATGQESMDKLIDGQLQVKENLRTGGFGLYFDAIEAHPEMKDAKDELNTFSGAIQISFERDVDAGSKSIDVKFDDFQILYEGFLDDDTFFSDESYNYRLDADGAGTFHLALYGQFDHTGWSGPETEKMILDMAWNADGTGRDRGQILEVDGTGDLLHGDLIIDECFKSGGYIAWRTINDPYVVDLPDYNLGAEDLCTVGADALP